MSGTNFIYSLVFFLLAGCAWGPSLFHSRADSDELTAGISYFQQSNFIKAKAVFLNLIETRIGSPEIEEAQWYLVLISEKLDKPNIVKQKIKLFIRSYPSSPHLKEAEAKMAAFNKKPISVPIEEATSLASLSKTDELTSGIQLFQELNFIKAKTVFKHVIETGNGSSEVEEAYWYLALISAKQDKPEIATESFKRFIKSFPFSPHKKEAEGIIATLNASSGQAPPELKEKGGGTMKEPEPKRIQARSGPDKISGSFITEYLYDQMTSPVSMNTQSRLSEFLDFRWRKGSGPDLRFIFSGMNANDLLQSRNNRARLSKFYLEGNNIDWFSNFRFGRQPSSGSTLFNRFDGLSFSLPFFPVIWTNNFGIPVDIFATDPLAIESDRKFYETYLSVVDFYHMTGKVYFTQEYFQNFSTRKAVGLNAFWMVNTLNITTLIDRDIDFNKFNDGMVSFDYTHSRFRYSGLVEYRRNPFLDYGNALADPSVVMQTPPITTLDVLQQTLTRNQIMQLALNNSQTTLDYSIGLSVDLSAIWRVDLRYGKTFYSPTDLGNHLLTFPLVNSDKTIDRYSIFILDRNFFNWKEIASTLFLYQPGTDSTNTSIVASMLKVWSNGFQGGVRFRYEDTLFNLTGSRLTRIVPGFVMRYSLKSGMEASLEGDYVMEENSLSPDWNNTIQTRTSVSIPF